MEPLRIGICDDAESDRERIGEMLKKLLPDFLPEQIPYEIQVFEEGEALLRSCMANPFSLVFTDIEMPEEGGMELAFRLNEASPDTGIVFVSNHQNYIFETQEFEPLWFVRKEKLEKDLKRAVNKYFQKYSYRWVNYKINDGFGKRNILLHSILYFEGCGHEVKAVTSKEHYRMYGSLAKIGEELIAHGFIRVHRNYLVNGLHISHVIGNELELCGKKRIPLGRSYKKKVLERMQSNAWQRE